MIARVPAPDGRMGRDGLPILVLPEGTILKDVYKVSYYTVGGMSIVYRGEKDKKIYLLKEVQASESQRVISLTQEKSMLDRFDHPGIVEIQDFFEQDGYYYMVLEFIEGKSMDRLICRKAGEFLDEKMVTEWALQLYDIFEYLHSQNPPVIYRDLKPQNIILDKGGRLKLVDFGIARVFKGGKAEDTFSMGSAITASPEHYGGKQTDGRSDIFTIGATLQYLLTNGQGSIEGLFSFVPIRILNPKYSEGLEQLIGKALQLEPEKRFQSVQEMRQAHLAVKEGKRIEEAEPAAAVAPLPAAAAPQAAATSSSSKAQQVVFICGALLLILLGTLLGLKLSKTAGKGDPPPSPTGSLMVAVTPSPLSTAAPSSPVPTSGISTQTAAPPPSPRPTVKTGTPQPQKSPVQVKKPRPSPAYVATKLPPPLPGATGYPSGEPRRPHRPKRPQKDPEWQGYKRPDPRPTGHQQPWGDPGGPGPSSQGGWIKDEKDGFRVFVPGGYEQRQGRMQNSITFQKEDQNRDPQSRRFVQVMTIPSVGSMEEFVTGHFGVLSAKRARILSKSLSRENRTFELTYSKSMEGGMEYSFKEILVRSHDGKKVFALTAGAPTESFPQHQGEFDAFFSSFQQSGGN